MATALSTARRNAVLDGLSDEDLTTLLPDLTQMPLELGDVLHEAGQPAQSVYFPLLGVVSVVADLGGDQVVETATIGREGIVGISVFLGTDTPTERSQVQVAGSALTMSVEDFRAAITDVDGPLTAMLRRSAQALFTMVSRNAACNRVHTVRQRAARWLLMTADRMDATNFPLTQQFLAQMLAVRRTSVGEVAQALADDGAITYTRGSITITEPQRLRSSACDCYDVIREATDKAMASR
ncbi:Crp/Fnr family transcriptional regulator [Modestobacter altitudinis]|uniref:Crp/Fnr family transcriptional regulator n=1 Tax=Modestobacter altitudinis TaxID=2213158 RepID=UPI00110CD4BD|nr:Crp/Fnr family transcriptional regulator [Modestobacter altitudinis]